MDLIRIFIDTAFSKASDRFLSDDSFPDFEEPVIEDGLLVGETAFVDECRIHHPELSDDQIKMIYGLFRDEWSIFPNLITEPNSAYTPNIFNVLFKFSSEVLRVKNNVPVVIFNNLFRWRELTLSVGEDTLVCAFLAYINSGDETSSGLRKSMPDSKPIAEDINFCGWPTILHNDNPHLNFIFRENRLCELHSHLYASADNFTVSWVMLMNGISGKEEQFNKLANLQDKSRGKRIASTLYSYVVRAASIRLMIWRFLTGRGELSKINFEKIADDPEASASDLQKEINKECIYPEIPDYIPSDKLSPMCIVGGERKFLYRIFKYILSHDNEDVSRLFYQYLLAKNRLRSFLVQVNSNRGFANFKRFQDLKMTFIPGKHHSVISRLAVWEAAVFNFTDLFETRITPVSNQRELKKMRKECLDISTPYEDGKQPDWSLIIHFIKHPENYKGDTQNGPGENLRDKEVRERVHAQSVFLKERLDIEESERVADACLSRIRGIDAASSEIGCRPEVFAQAFRYLKDSGFAATFHVGEDFYDIADGLRAIQEAIAFLGLEAGDRLGHALALGVDPDEFYAERHSYIALPVQWMLDNVTWLYYKSREYNISIEPGTEDFLIQTFRSLVRRIGYEGKKESYETIEKIEMTDYYQSMLLRGDAPSVTLDSRIPSASHSRGSWERYGDQPQASLNEIRGWNKQAGSLLADYYNNDAIRRNGMRIASFVVPSGYPKLIRQMQDCLIKEVSKRQLGIECCPSSNYKIGYCKRFDRHPVFRFLPVKGESRSYPLAVTINTDDLGVFSTSLPNEFSLLALALLKMKDKEGNHIYSTQEVYDWIERVVRNGRKYSFRYNELAESDLNIDRF